MYQQQQPLYIADWSLDERFVRDEKLLSGLGHGYRSLCRLPLCAPNGPLGVLTFVSMSPHAYSEEEKQFLSLVSDRVALAVANALNVERSRRVQPELR